MSVRNTRTVFTLAGLAMALAGVVFWLVGDDNEASGRNGMDMNSSSTWGDVLDFESDQDDEYADAQDKKETGEAQQILGILLGVAGLGTLLTGVAMRPARTKEV